MMIEPTETETPETLEQFCQTMEKIVQEIKDDPQMVKSAPHTTPVRRLDDVKAAREPVAKWDGWNEPMNFGPASKDAVQQSHR
jgi:glycine dehydrogenase subunit 2